MEALTYLYLWDSRWCWGLPYPPRTCWLWAVVLVANLINLTQLAADLTAPRTLLTLLTLPPLASLFVRHQSIESKRVLPFVTDEDTLRIGHYLKRRQVVYTHESALVLIIGLVKVLSYLVWGSGPIFVAPDDSSLLAPALTAIAWLDYVAIVNICTVAFTFVTTKTITIVICQKYCPFFLSKVKAKLAQFTSPTRISAIAKTK